MVEVSSWNFALGLTALLLAVWPQMIDSAFDRLDEIESDYNKFVAGSLMVTGLALIGIILIMTGFIMWLEGGMNKVLLSIIIAALLITTPSFATFYSRCMSYGKEVSRAAGLSVVVIELIIGVIVIWLMVTAGTLTN